jgi:hypothetical protein
MDSLNLKLSLCALGNRFSVGSYRLAARAVAIALQRHPIVESVYVGRSVGRGEVSFGRSDIDLQLIVRTPDPESADGPELASLYWRMCVLRKLNPALGHMMVFDPQGLDRWSRTDTVLSSLERRSVILLTGKDNPIPHVPTRREDAIRWVAYWNESFFPIAVRQRNGRNLRKISTEIWKAWAVARGITPEPYLTKRESEIGARTDPAGAGLLGKVHDPEFAVKYVMTLAGILHDDLFPKLRPLQNPIIIRMPLPPRSFQRVLVVLPQQATLLPSEAFDSQSFVATPELFHLYIHFVNPFMNWSIPEELKDMGFLSPEPREFVRACSFYGQDNMLRLPGFVRPDTWTPGTTVAVNRYCIPYLRNGEIPPPMPESAVRIELDHRPTVSEYYLRDFARLYRESVEHWEILQRLEKDYGDFIK